MLHFVPVFRCILQEADRLGHQTQHTNSSGVRHKHIRTYSLNLPGLSGMCRC